MHLVWTLCAVVSFASCVAVPMPSIDPSSPSPPSHLAAATDPRGVLVTSAEAIERVVAFVEAPEQTGDLTVRGPMDGVLIRFYEVVGHEVDATVNAHDGTVATLLMLSSVGTGGPTTDADQAVGVAQEFLTQRQVPFDDLDQTVRLQDHGETSEYVVEWIGHEGDVIVPNSREVGVDSSTGRVFRYAYSNRAYDPPPAPTVDRATAETIALRAANGSPRAQIARSELLITFVPFDVQRLVWHVYVDDGISHAVVEVDAETGAASVIGRG
jgi:hypothetical protein